MIPSDAFVQDEAQGIDVASFISGFAVIRSGAIYAAVPITLPNAV